MGVEGLKAASTLATEILKLSAALLALSVTFVDKFKASADVALHAPCQLKLAWAAYLFSCGFAIWTLMAITGTMREADRNLPASNPTESNIRLPAGFMLGSFLLAVACTAWTGITLT
jgi:hypothetical protein